MNVVECGFDVRGRRIAARCWHDASLPPLLALHGWQDNAATFDRLAPLLPEFHIVAMDFAGHGFSDWRPEGVRYHTVDHVDDVLAVLDQLGWDKFSLLGHSMGAGIGVLLAGALPARIERLLLIDGIGPWPAEAEQAPQILREALLEWQAYAPREERVFDDMESAVVARRRGFTPLSDEAARLLCRRGVKAVPGGFSWTLDRRVRQHSPQRFSEAEAQAFLRHITAPVLLVRAEPGFPAAAAMFDARWPLLRQGVLRRMEGSHHLHLEEQAPAVAAAIREFCAHN
ncbi:MAG: alpha/beta hydrolase [Moraxellaceae bacterium]|jgi:pimeloyl-ACP methyl ester carboxylesterase|nr:alpha/beta hydrolase [Moraxellaceae bacterium]